MQVSKRYLSETTLHPDFRWDGEYLCFEPYKNKSLKYLPIGDTLIFSQYGLSIEMNEEGNGIKIYRMNEISNMMCDRNILKYAPITHEQIESYQLKDRDILFNRTNSQIFVGRTGIFRNFSYENIVFASYLVRIKPDPDIVTPEYLTAFLNTKYGVLDVKRRARISINQSNVNAEELKRVEIPLVSRQLQLQITKIFDDAFKLIQKSESKYNQAQTLLETELGQTDWQPKHQLTFVKKYSDTQQAERIDAEYFQPKYEKLVSAIKNYAGGWDTLENMVYLNEQRYNPKDTQEYKYIELANIANYGEISGCMIDTGEDLPSRARRRVSTGDIIISSIEGSLSSIAMIEKEYHQALCSTGFHVVNSKNFNSETLLILMKSIPGQLQLKKGCSGTILTAVNKDELNKVIFPIITEQKQTEIQQKVSESFKLRKQSKHLLECAKQAVEMAIEKNEQKAINWLKNESNCPVAG